MYVSTQHTYEQKHNLQADSFEHIWVDIKIDKSLYTVNVWYRPPNIDNHDQFMNTSEDILSRLHTYNSDNKIIMSDFNFGNCYCKHPVLSDKPLDSIAPELFESYGFTQVIDIPTRTTRNTTSLVDLVYIQNQDNLTIHGTLPKIADHDGTLVSFHSIKPKVMPRTRTIYEYNKVNEIELINYIKNYDFQNIVFSQPLVDQPKLITTILTGAFHKFVPSKQVVIRPNAPAWTNTYTRLLQRQKNRNYIIYKKANSEYIKAVSNSLVSAETLTRLLNKKVTSYDKSHEARNTSTNANRRAQKAFYSSVNSTMNNPNISAKKKYGILTKLMKNQKVSSIPSLIDNNKTVTDSKQKSDLLNRHFASKSTVPNPNDVPPQLNKFDLVSDLSQINTSPIELSKLIRTMKKASQSHCGIPGKFLSLIATPISFPLSTMFNDMFREGFFPDIFKIAHITAIWKQKGLKSSKESYRPICLLPTLSKICEAVMHQRLLSHLTENKLISDRQAAYGSNQAGG